uniref:Uncharacterized protein n=2 Tax=root TaxID=1 RepID=A0A8S5UUL2_9CAUD|nr:MAG TPA: hypothetical protein [Myoviridae sp. ctP6q2]DAM09013.1 MAG TPA: hypothetical protein [Caudoviricetes sp.]
MRTDAQVQQVVIKYNVVKLLPLLALQVRHRRLPYTHTHARPLISLVTFWSKTDLSGSSHQRHITSLFLGCDGPCHVASCLLAHVPSTRAGSGCCTGSRRVKDYSCTVHEHEIESHVLVLGGTSTLDQNGLIDHRVTTFPDGLVLGRGIQDQIKRIGRIHYGLRVLTDELAALVHLHSEHTCRVNHIVGDGQCLCGLSAQHAPRTVDLVVPLVRQSGSDLVTAHARYGFQNAALPFVPKGKILVVTGNDRHMLLVSDPLGDGDAIDELDGVAGIPYRHGSFTLDGTRGRSTRLDQILDDLQSVVIRRTGLVRDKLEMSRLTAKRVGGDIARELDLDIIEIPFHGGRNHQPFRHPRRGENEGQDGLERSEIRCDVRRRGRFAHILLIQISLVTLDGRHVYAALLRKYDLSGRAGQTHDAPPSPVVSVLSVPSELSVLSSPQEAGVNTSTGWSVPSISSFAACGVRQMPPASLALSNTVSPGKRATSACHNNTLPSAVLLRISVRCNRSATSFVTLM